MARGTHGDLRGVIGKLETEMAKRDGTIQRMEDLLARGGKRAPTSAPESHPILQALMDHVPEGIVIALAPDARPRMMNRHGQRLTGFRSGGIAGTSRKPPVEQWKIFRSDGATRPVAAELPLTRAVRKGEVVTDEEWVIQRSDGTKIWTVWNAGPVRGLDGTILGGVAAWRDISERKRNEQQLEEQALELQEQGRLLDLAHLLARDLDDRIILWNRGAERLYGWSRAEAIGMVSHDRFQTVFPQPLDEIKAMFFREGSWEGELVHTRKDGSKITVASHWVLDRDERGVPVAILEVNNDTTPLKRAEEALRESEERFSLVARAANDAIWDYNLVTGTVWWNEAYSSLYGEGPRKTARYWQWWVAHIHPEDRGRVEESLRAALTGTDLRWNAEYRHRRVDGSWATVLDRAYVARGSDGEPRRVVGAMQDITDRKRAEDRVREFSRRTLAVREEEKSRLAAALHHDVGSLAVGMSARLNAVEEDLRDEKTGDALKSLEESRDLFDRSVARLKELAAEIRPPDLDILGLAAALRQYFSQMARDTTLRIHFADSTRGRAIHHEAATVLFRIAQESITNAVKHAHAKRARVRLGVSKRTVRLSIRDDGVGFDPAQRAKDPGAGMGLRAMREMAISQGGKLEIESGPGLGTLVAVTLPAEGERA